VGVRRVPTTVDTSPARAHNGPVLRRPSSKESVRGRPHAERPMRASNAPGAGRQPVGVHRHLPPHPHGVSQVRRCLRHPGLCHAAARRTRPGAEPVSARAERRPRGCGGLCGHRRHPRGTGLARRGHLVPAEGVGTGPRRSRRRLKAGGAAHRARYRRGGGRADAGRAGAHVDARATLRQGRGRTLRAGGRRAPALRPARRPDRGAMAQPPVRSSGHGGTDAASRVA